MPSSCGCSPAPLLPGGRRPPSPSRPRSCRSRRDSFGSNPLLTIAQLLMKAAWLNRKFPPFGTSRTLSPGPWNGKRRVEQAEANGADESVRPSDSATESTLPQHTFRFLVQWSRMRLARETESCCRGFPGEKRDWSTNWKLSTMQFECSAGSVT